MPFCVYHKYNIHNGKQIQLCNSLTILFFLTEVLKILEGLTGQAYFYIYEIYSLQKENITWLHYSHQEFVVVFNIKNTTISYTFTFNK